MKMFTMKLFNHAINRQAGGRRSVIIRAAGIPITLALLTAAIFIAPALSAPREDVGTSCADCPNYSGAFSIENETGVAIAYQMRWGERNPWKQFVLQTGGIETHSYPLGEDKGKKVPIPCVRFDPFAGGGRSTPIEYQMDFYAVGYAGYGPSANTTTPKKYFFKFGPGHKSINLFARKF